MEKKMETETTILHRGSMGLCWGSMGFVYG